MPTPDIASPSILSQPIEADQSVDALFRRTASGEDKPLSRDPVIEYLGTGADQGRPLLDQPMPEVETYRP